MRFIKLLLALIVGIILVTILNRPPLDVPILNKYARGTALAQLPPLGRLLNPFTGAWQLGEKFKKAELPKSLHLSDVGLKNAEQAAVVYDKRLVPHIHAANNYDLYFLQGYITATHRLWQMEFQTYAAAGRVSEIIGAKAIDYDKTQRRLGMVWAAEKSLAKIMEDPDAAEALTAYSDGVNAYIKQNKNKKLSIEYRLLGYEPEAWTPLKSALLLKYMAADLNGSDSDLEMTNAKRAFPDEFAVLYPDFVAGQDPIIPSGTPFNFQPIEIDTTADGIRNRNADPQSTDTNKALSLLQFTPLPKPDPDNGSNNWAIGGSRTKGGKPILANDPHLGLNLPSLWFEVQLSSPELNCYGVSLPGAPSIIIGYNQHIAWGVTNAGRDVRDWYTISFVDETQNQYHFENEIRPIQNRIEQIIVARGDTIRDTVKYTHLGPIVYQADKGNAKSNMALRWIGHDAGNELQTFYELNRAQNINDYFSALTHYISPAQNFVFAANNGDIALRQQGKFPLRWQQQGKTILDGSLAKNEWQAYIPMQHLPQLVNPERGFVSSANQQLTNADYPYYYNGTFEYYRNRRINQQLSTFQDATANEVMQLQNDNYSLKAAEALPLLLSYLPTVDSLGKGEARIYQLLKKWNFQMEANTVAPTLFEKFFDKAYHLSFDELDSLQNNNTPVAYPNEYVFTQLLATQPNFSLFDYSATPNYTETAKDIVRKAFAETVEWVATKEADPDNTTGYTWGSTRGALIEHLLQIPALSRSNFTMSGGADAVNSMKGQHGPSWRMIVDFNTPTGKPKGYGNYPGGQSGNAGSPYYDNQIQKWAKGQYYTLNFYNNIPQLTAESDTSILLLQEIK